MNKRVQMIGFPKPVSRSNFKCVDLNKSVEMPEQYAKRIDAYWEQHHKGWASSPIANLEAVLFAPEGAVLRTSTSEYKNYKGADVIGSEGDLNILNFTQTIGNEVLTQTRDGLFVFPYRGDMPIAPQAYYCGGGLVAAMYCIPDGAKKLRDPARASLPPHQRFTKEECTIIPEYNNPLAHVIPRLVEERGVKKEQVLEDSLRLFGFAYGVNESRNPSASIHVRLDITAEEYQKAQKDRVDWLENSTGKKQDKRRQEIEHDAYISADDMPAFLLGRLEKDALGRQLVVSPRAGKIDLIDGALGSALLYVLHEQPETGLTLLNKLGRQGHRFELVEPKDGAYRFSIRE
jgi:hypothetical protein